MSGPPKGGTGQGAGAPQAGSGRYVLVRDRDGRRTALARHAVSAVCEAEDGGTVLLLPGGRVVRVEEDLDTVLGWLA